MIKNLLIIVFLSFTVITAQSKLPLTLEDIYYNEKFAEKLIENIQWRPDSEAFSFTKENTQTGYLDIHIHDVKNGNSRVLVKGNELVYDSKVIEMSSYQWTSDGEFFLIEGPRKSIWRHSSQAPFFLYNVKTKEITALANNDKHLRNVKLSPDGKFVGFVRAHNIYIADLSTGEEKQITHNGTVNILNGEFDWVYEEEFGLADAWRWSPDSKKIAFWQFDQTRVKEFHLVDEMPLYNEVFKLKYPKVGEQNSIVKIGVAHLETDKTTFMDLGDNDDIYAPRIFWTNSSSLLSILRLNRRQDVAELLMSNTNNGESKVIITDTDPAWVEVTHDISFLKSRDQIIFSSEKSGYRHAYLYDYEGKLIRQITSGDWEIKEISGVDEKNNWLYFYGKKDSPMEENVYRVRLDGTELARISRQPGWHDPVFSPNYKYFIDNYSTSTSPTSTVLHSTDGNEIRIINKGKIEGLEDYNITFPEFVTVTTTDGTKLNAYFIKPYDFNPDKKYPVLVYGYGGPGSQKVTNKWADHQRWFGHYMASHGYVVFCLDNRGTGGRGKAFKNLSYGDLSKWSIHDQIEGAKYLAALNYVDKDRIGFWGWSGGGYLTIGVMTRAADYFKVGASVAPVTDFYTYDAIWAERQMGLPSENAEGYQKANLQNYVDMLKGKLLIIHGTGDDNVHYQNTLQFIDKCVNKNKQVDMFLYPNKNHFISGGYAKVNVYTKIRNYFDDNL